MDDDEGRRFLRIVRHGTGSVLTQQLAPMVLRSAQGMPVSKIAEVTFTSRTPRYEMDPTSTQTA